MNDTCTLCDTGVWHMVFVTVPPGWGSIMPCNENTRKNGVIVKSNAEIDELRLY